MKTRTLPALFASAALFVGMAQAETPIPRSMAGDKGSYFLIEATRSGDVVKALHKRSGPSGVTFTRTETNCKTMQMREMGTKDDLPAGMKINPTKWFDLVPGSSKSDVANFVCKR